MEVFTNRESFKLCTYPNLKRKIGVQGYQRFHNGKGHVAWDLEYEIPMKLNINTETFGGYCSLEDFEAKSERHKQAVIERCRLVREQALALADEMEEHIERLSKCSQS